MHFKPHQGNIDVFVQWFTMLGMAYWMTVTIVISKRCSLYFMPWIWHMLFHILISIRAHKRHVPEMWLWLLLANVKIEQEKQYKF